MNIRIEKSEIRKIDFLIRGAQCNYTEAYGVYLTLRYGNAVVTTEVYNWLVTQKQDKKMCIDGCEMFMSSLPKEITYDEAAGGQVAGCIMPNVFLALGLPAPAWSTQTIR